MSSEEINALRARADILLEIGRYGEAMLLIESGLHLEPDNAPLLCRMAFAFLKLNDLPQAMRYADEAVSADPTEEWGHRLRSAILLEGKEAAQAVLAAEEAVALNPASEQSLHALIKALLKAKQKERAEEIAAHLRRISPDSMWTHNGSALAAMHLHQWERVQQHCRAGLALNPELYEDMNNLGMALVHLGRYQEAIICFQEAARLMPTDKTIHQRISLAQYTQRLQEIQAKNRAEKTPEKGGSLHRIDSDAVKFVKRGRKLIQPTNL